MLMNHLAQLLKHHMATVLHTADTHLGYQQYHRPERVEDYADAFAQTIDAAISKDVDALIHAGDLFQDSRPNAATFLTVVTELRRLTTHNIPFLMVIGNHEDTRNSQWADILTEMNLATRLGEEPTIIDNTAFYGLDYVPTTRRAQLDYQYPDHNAEYAALVAHGGFQPLCIHDDWNAEHILGTSNITFDALLLGDDHTPKTQTLNNTIATYPGSTERTAHDQRAPRQYNLVEFGGFTDGVSIDHIELDTRPFIYIDETELEPDDTPRAIRDQIDAQPVTDAIVIITLDGDGDPFTTAELEQYTLDAGALVAKARDLRTLDNTDADLDVSFADPDEAVERRIRELELSVVGSDLDHTVRDTAGIPDSNLADSVKETMDDRVDDSPEDFDTDATYEPLPEPAETPAQDPADEPQPDQPVSPEPTDSETDTDPTTDTEDKPNTETTDGGENVPEDTSDQSSRNTDTGDAATSNKTGEGTNPTSLTDF